MAIATYKTRAGAQWYANELAKAHPGCTFEVVPGNDWNFHVKVTMADGRTALAERRPANFGKDKWIMQPKFAKRHYEIVAKSIKASIAGKTAEERRAIFKAAVALADEFANDNWNFQIGRFL